MDSESAVATDYCRVEIERSVASSAAATTEKATLMVIGVPFVRPVMIVASLIAVWSCSPALRECVDVPVSVRPPAVSA